MTRIAIWVVCCLTFAATNSAAKKCKDNDDSESYPPRISSACIDQPLEDSYSDRLNRSRNVNYAGGKNESTATASSPIEMSARQRHQLLMTKLDQFSQRNSTDPHRHRSSRRRPRHQIGQSEISYQSINESHSRRKDPLLNRLDGSKLQHWIQHQQSRKLAESRLSLASKTQQKKLAKLESLTKLLVRLMRNMTKKSAKTSRYFRTDLRAIRRSFSQLKNSSLIYPLSSLTHPNQLRPHHGLIQSNKKSGVKRSANGASFLCPSEFVGGGTWSSCYRLSNHIRATWYEARSYCNALGANLASLETIKEAYIVDYLIKSYDVNDQNENQAKTDYSGGINLFWTSANYIARSQSWMWTSKQHLRPITYSRWAPGEPNARSTMHCMVIGASAGFHWSDAFCSDKHLFVCEIDLNS